MTVFVIEAEVMVPEWKKHSRHYYLGKQAVEKLIAELPLEHIGLIRDAEELEGLLTKQGAISTLVAVSGSHEKAKQFLNALAVAAWKDSIPWHVDEIEDSHKGDERFGAHLSTCVISDKECKALMEGMK